MDFNQKFCLFLARLLLCDCHGTWNQISEHYHRSRRIVGRSKFKVTHWTRFFFSFAIDDTISWCDRKRSKRKQDFNRNAELDEESRGNFSIYIPIVGCFIYLRFHLIFPRLWMRPHAFGEIWSHFEYALWRFLTIKMIAQFLWLWLFVK